MQSCVFEQNSREKTDEKIGSLRRKPEKRRRVKVNGRRKGEKYYVGDRRDEFVSQRINGGAKYAADRSARYPDEDALEEITDLSFRNEHCLKKFPFP